MTDSARNNSNDAQKGATVFAVTSGKGGVGKTSLSVNLACEFSRRGYRTMLVDADLGLANAHILAGMKPGKTLSDYVDGRATLSEVIEEGPARVRFLTGGSGVKDMANLEADGRNKILAAIEELRPHCDVILVDTGAEMSIVGPGSLAILTDLNSFEALPMVSSHMVFPVLHHQK